MRKNMILPDYTPAQLENQATYAALLRYVDAVRTHGHRAAQIDPLNLIEREEVAALDPSRYGLTDRQQLFSVDGIVWTNPTGPNLPSKEVWSLDRIVSHLRAVYVGNIAYEYMHSPSKTERLWFSHILESSAVAPQNVRKPDEKRRMWELMARSEVFDQFLQVKFPNLKRYGLEGGESMLPALDTLFSVASRTGIEHIVLAMPHRGRLNLLTDLLQFPPSALFHKIKGGSEIPENLGYSGDVISHLVANPTLRYGSRTIEISLLPNPSHLEAVDPVALGKTRAKQFTFIRKGEERCKFGDKVMCVQLHGDASFTGQGVVMECLGLSNLPYFTSGGAVHLVVNVGFTTSPFSARSSQYCTDVGKMINAPIIHVNGDCPEDVSRALETAFQYRHTFRKDVIVDLQGYRRWGHNELDDPTYTQPLMYERIRARKSIPAHYEDKLRNEGVISREDTANLRSSYESHLESELQKSDSFTPAPRSYGEGWNGMVLPTSVDANRDPETGVELETLKMVGRASVQVPGNFEIHPTLKQYIDARLGSVEAGSSIDWATAEAMALGSLLLDGYDVRLSGQDSVRGTFTQRHAAFVDQLTENVTVPLNAALNSEGRLELVDSSLSEMAVLGFEYGMSWETPKLLPIWEAQFGDFFNGAQVMFDTFVSSAESKWMMQSGIVVLLPHGLEGGGPEHSSMRIERMLQLTNDPCEYHEGDKAAGINMHVVYPTTPAQYFHLLRRQMKRNYRRPLIVASPKGLLHLQAAASSLDDFKPGVRFREVIDDDEINDPASVECVIILSGKIYYELAKERAAVGLQDSNKVALIRIEELSPFPYKLLANVLRRYQKAEWYFLQEEPRNQGPWTHVFPRLLEVQRKAEGKVARIKYIGRKEDAVPATGVGKFHKHQQNAVLREAFVDLKKIHPSNDASAISPTKAGILSRLKRILK